MGEAVAAEEWSSNHGLQRGGESVRFITGSRDAADRKRGARGTRVQEKKAQLKCK